jgi:FkbM family methyltransferase
MWGMVVRIILDLGAHKLEGCKKLIHIFKENASQICIFCWEPNPFIFEETKNNAYDLSLNHDVKIECRNYAASTKKEKIKFNIDESKTSQGCNILECPMDLDVTWGTKYKWNNIFVDAESIKEFIDQLELEAKDEIYVKCDIEGAEFDVLPDILKSVNIKYVKKIFVEWHERYWHPHESFKEIERKLIEDNFSKLGIEVIQWE